ncbi:MAG: hypothetical protein AAB876_01780, partial [Patescibacteria group bacterium]
FHLKAGDLLEVKFDRSGISLKPAALADLSGDDYEKLSKKLDSLKKRKGKTCHSTADVRKHLDRLTSRASGATSVPRLWRGTRPR